MIRGLPHPFEGKGVAGKKDKSDQGVATEADPLLSSNPGGRTAQTHFSGTVRARRSSRSPSTNTFPMDSSALNRQQGHGDRFGTYQHSDEYAYHEELSQSSRSSSASYTGGGSTATPSNQQGLPVYSQQVPSDAPATERIEQERKAGMYRPNPISESPQRGGVHPPLLEIPEEVYAVRKAALQVLKPLTSSWVSPLNPLISL